MSMREKMEWNCESRSLLNWNDKVRRSFGAMKQQIVTRACRIANGGKNVIGLTAK